MTPPLQHSPAQIADTLWWSDLVTRRNTWVTHNFPGDIPTRSVIGVIEEMGELAHCHLKLAQGIRGDEDLAGDRKDAIADLTIYLLGVLNHLDHIPQTPDARLLDRMFRQDDPDFLLMMTSSYVGQLAFDYRLGKPTGDVVHYCDLLVYCLRRYSVVLGIEFRDIVKETWAKVEERDWIAYPDSAGRPPVEA